MKSTDDKANEKIDDMAKAAKHKVEHVIDDARDVATLAAEKARKHIHDAGEKVKDVGERLLKLAE